MSSKVPVIIVTDGDSTAQKAVEAAAYDLGLYPLKISGGNPTHYSVSTIREAVLNSPLAPVIVMVDDQGEKGVGPGEKVIEELLKCPDQIEVLGIIAVASDSPVKGVTISKSIDRYGRVVNGPVNKEGLAEPQGNTRLEGDTVEVLKNHPDLLVIGCGDPGKMDGKDAAQCGAFITSRCLQEILEGGRTPVVQKR